MFLVIATHTYFKSITKWPKHEQTIAGKIVRQLRQNPLAGKPLSYPFLREKRVKEKRIYYLVYTDLELVVLVATNTKKDQNLRISKIKEHFTEYRTLAEKIIRDPDSDQSANPQDFP